MDFAIEKGLYKMPKGFILQLNLLSINRYPIFSEKQDPHNISKSE